MTTDARHERRLREIEQRRQGRARGARQAAQRQQRLRAVSFAAVIVAVLGIGGYLAFGNFFNRPAAAVGTIDLQSSMAGFTPSTITVTARTVATLNWWTDDAALHMTGGVHTMISPELGLNEQLPAESRRTLIWQVPDMPGTYDVWCDSCCGGKAAPQMHGKIVIVPGNA
jgi:heme/copper-type cytochrome/quinol oxidase subunit 2